MKNKVSDFAIALAAANKSKKVLALFTNLW